MIRSVSKMDVERHTSRHEVREEGQRVDCHDPVTAPDADYVSRLRVGRLLGERDVEAER